MRKIIPILAFIITRLSFGQVDKAPDTLEVWTVFSTGNFVNQNAEKIVAKNWPFRIKGIAGDAISEGIIDSLQLHNNRVWNYLDANGYNNSKEEFESELLQENNRIKKAVEISNSDKNVSELYAKLRKSGLQNYTELSKINNTRYEFTVYSYDLNHLEKDQVFEMKFITDLENGKTGIIE